MCVFQRLILHYDARMQQFPQRLAEHDKSVSPKRLITLVTMGGLSQVGSSREGVEAFVARWSLQSATIGSLNTEVEIPSILSHPGQGLIQQPPNHFIQKTQLLNNSKLFQQ